MTISDKVHLSVSKNILTINGNKVILDNRQSELLSFFFNNQNTTYSKQYIIDNIWKTTVGEQAVIQTVFKIRKVFKQHGIHFPIKTIPKKGYVYAPFLYEKENSSNDASVFYCYKFILLSFLFMLDIFSQGNENKNFCQLNMGSELIEFNQCNENNHFMDDKCYPIN